VLKPRSKYSPWDSSFIVVLILEIFGTLWISLLSLLGKEPPFVLLFLKICAFSFMHFRIVEITMVIACSTVLRVVNLHTSSTKM
jgi:hypothetical protein